MHGHPYINQDVREKPDEVGWFSHLTLSWSIIAFRTSQWNENKRFSSYVPCPCWQHHLIIVVRASMMPDLTPWSRSPGTHRHTIRHVPGSQALQSEKKTMASLLEVRMVDLDRNSGQQWHLGIAS